MESRRTGRSFRAVVNDTLRRGLASRQESKKRTRFTVVTRDLGERRPDLSLDSIADALDRVEGPLHR
jgi:hypothetical protein